MQAQIFGTLIAMQMQVSDTLMETQGCFQTQQTALPKKAPHGVSAEHRGAQAGPREGPFERVHRDSSADDPLQKHMLLEGVGGRGGSLKIYVFLILGGSTC